MKVSHYNTGDIEVIDFIRDQLTPEEFNGFCKGNILKYVPRSNHKGDPIADAQKVRDYADYWINANMRVNKVAELGQVSTEKAQELADTIVELRRDNAELKEKIETQKADIKHFRKRIDELRDDKLQLEKLNKKLDADLKKAEKDRFNSVKMAEALRESVDRLQKEKESLEANYKKLRKDIDVYQSNQEVILSSKNKAIQNLKTELEEKEVVIESLESQVGALLTEVKQREAESLQAQHEPPISNVDPSGRIAPADDVPDIDAILNTDDDLGPINYDKFKNA